ncbi:MAG: hypothetical protein QHH09_02370 [Microgenomates group bacterium]|nr:hypothetical protein [Microgenomates group bacterium]
MASPDTRPQIGMVLSDPGYEFFILDVLKKGLPPPVYEYVLNLARGVADPQGPGFDQRTGLTWYQLHDRDFGGPALPDWLKRDLLILAALTLPGTLWTLLSPPSPPAVFLDVAPRITPINTRREVWQISPVVALPFPEVAERNQLINLQTGLIKDFIKAAKAMLSDIADPWVVEALCHDPNIPLVLRDRWRQIREIRPVHPWVDPFQFLEALKHIIDNFSQLTQQTVAKLLSGPDNDLAQCRTAVAAASVTWLARLLRLREQLSAPEKWPPMLKNTENLVIAAKSPPVNWGKQTSGRPLG